MTQLPKASSHATCSGQNSRQAGCLFPNYSIRNLTGSDYIHVPPGSNALSLGCTPREFLFTFSPAPSKMDRQIAMGVRTGFIEWCPKWMMHIHFWYLELQGRSYITVRFTQLLPLHWNIYQGTNLVFKLEILKTQIGFHSNVSTFVTPQQTCSALCTKFHCNTSFSTKVLHGKKTNLKLNRMTTKPNSSLQLSSTQNPVKIRI